MRNLVVFVLLVSPAQVVAQPASAPMPEAVATYPATLHERISSYCELIEPAKLVQYKQYDALTVAGTTSEIYSPELRKGDFVAFSGAVPKKVVRSAKESKFEVRVGPSDASGLTDRPTTNGSSCPDLRQAISDVERQRVERRMDLQKRIHKLGSDVLPPARIRQTMPEPAAQTGATPKVKKQGTAILAIVVGLDGKVHDVTVVRTLDPVLDKKAIEAVQQWQFSPARMDGLPVQVDVEVNFRLW